jgi:hypothetical protein
MSLIVIDLAHLAAVQNILTLRAFHQVNYETTPRTVGAAVAENFDILIK